MSEQGRLDGPAGTEPAQNTRPIDLDPENQHAQETDNEDSRPPPVQEDATAVAEPLDSPSPGSSSQDLNVEDKKIISATRETETAVTVRTDHDAVSPVDQSTTTETLVDETLVNEKTVEPRHKPADIPTLTFRRGRRRRYVPIPEQKLRNNLSGMVGYLEFANALDFAANVWNTIPVPVFAAVLMGLGGGTAIILSFFALLDGLKCWKNVKVLRKERAELQAAMRDEERASPIDGYDLDVKVEVNRRELGQEIVDRLSMDIFMGFSSLVVGVGTCLAIAGANPRIYHASNLLSGYIGNSPSAFWGLGNTLWSAYLFRRASRHYVIGTRDLRDEAVKARLKRRTRSVQIHSFVMGLSTLVSAPCGMVTATMWQGYPPLIPCIILAKWGNEIWRRRLGYTRFPISAQSPSVDAESLIEELNWTIALQDDLSKDKKINLKDYIQIYRGSDTATAFMSRIGLLEDLCLALLKAGCIKHGNGETIEVDREMIEDCERQGSMFASTATRIFQKKARRVLAYRERYLLELLGASVYDATFRRRQSISKQTTKRG